MATLNKKSFPVWNHTKCVACNKKLNRLNFNGPVCGDHTIISFQRCFRERCNGWQMNDS